MALVVVAEAALFIALSAELDHLWLYPLRRLRVRVRRPLAGVPDVVPLQAPSAAGRTGSAAAASDGSSGPAAVGDDSPAPPKPKQPARRRRQGGISQRE